MKFWQDWKKTLSLLFIIAAAAFILRIYNLTLLPVFVDEAIYIRWSQVMSAEATLRFLPLSDGKQPLFMWFLMFVVKKFSDPLFIGRLVSVFSGTLSVLGIFSLSYLLFRSKKVSLMASFMWAISPFSLFFDRLALVDSMLTMFCIWTVFFALISFSKKRIDAAMVAGILLGLAALTKSPALFIALLMPVGWFFSTWPTKKNSAIHLIKLLPLTLIIWVIAFVMYNILRLGPNFQLLLSRNYDYVYPYSHILSSPFNPLFGHLGGIWNYFVLLAPLGIVFLLLVGIATSLGKYKPQTLILLTFAVLPVLAIAEYSKVVTARYLLFTFPFFVIIAASAFNSDKKLVNRVVLALFALFIGQSLLTDYHFITKVEAANLPQGERSGYLEEWTAGQGIKEISDYLKAEAKVLPSGSKIVVGTEGYFGTLPDGLQMYMEGVPNVVVIGIGLGIDKVPPSLADSKKAGNKTYLVINKSRITATPEKIGLKLIKEYPKASRKVGSIEYNRDGPQEFLYFFEVK